LTTSLALQASASSGVNVKLHGKLVVPRSLLEPGCVRGDQAARRPRQRELECQINSMLLRVRAATGTNADINNGIIAPVAKRAADDSAACTGRVRSASIRPDTPAIRTRHVCHAPPRHPAPGWIWPGYHHWPPAPRLATRHCCPSGDVPARDSPTARSHLRSPADQPGPADGPVEHRLGHLDQPQIGKRRRDQVNEEQRWRRHKAEPAADRQGG